MRLSSLLWITRFRSIVKIKNPSAHRDEEFLRGTTLLARSGRSFDHHRAALFRANGRIPPPASTAPSAHSLVKLLPLQEAAGEFGPGISHVLYAHLAGLTPRSPGSLVDDLLLLLSHLTISAASTQR